MPVCDCGAEVPDEEGPTHTYMRSLPACWRRYGELMARLLAPGGTRATSVDAYAAQHPAGAEHDRRQRQSVAVHLVALCAHLEREVPEPMLTRVRGTASATVLPAVGLEDWPLLSPPATLGALNAPALATLADAQLGPALDAWSGDVWTAWQDHHDLVRSWTDAALAGRSGRHG